MQTTVKLIAVAASAAFLAGCNNEDGAFQMPNYNLNSVTLKTATMPITQDDAQSLALAGLEMEYLANDYSELSADSSGTVRKPTVRASQQQTLDCPTSGTMSISASAEGINEQTSEMEENGSLSLVTSFIDCTDDVYQDGNWVEVTNGGVTVNMAWAGYSEANSDFDEIAMQLLFNNFQMEETYYGTVSSEMLHGGIVVSFDGISTELDFKLSMNETTETGGETVSIESTQTIVYGDMYYYPISGAWTIYGAEGNHVDAVVTTSGLEYAYNDVYVGTYLW